MAFLFLFVSFLKAFGYFVDSMVEYFSLYFVVCCGVTLLVSIILFLSCLFSLCCCYDVVAMIVFAVMYDTYKLNVCLSLVN